MPLLCKSYNNYKLKGLFRSQNDCIKYVLKFLHKQYNRETQVKAHLGDQPHLTIPKPTSSWSKKGSKGNQVEKITVKGGQGKDNVAAEICAN